MEGGFQVDCERAALLRREPRLFRTGRGAIARPGGVAWTIFDARIAAIARQFEDFRQAKAPAPSSRPNDRGARRAARTARRRAGRDLRRGAEARRGRDVSGALRGRPCWRAPLQGVKVTGGSFHTQGGLVVDNEARVRFEDGGEAPNLFAAGGAAAGVSGSRRAAISRA